MIDRVFHFIHMQAPTYVMAHVYGFTADGCFLYCADSLDCQRCAVSAGDGRQQRRSTCGYLEGWWQQYFPNISLTFS